MVHYNDELRRVVTVCDGIPYKITNSWYIIALVFYDRKRNLTRDEQIMLMFHPDVCNVFDDLYYGIEIKNKHNPYSMFYIVSNCAVLHVQKNDNHPFFLVRKDILYETTINTVYNRCVLLQKWLRTDRCKCSWNSERCIHTWHEHKIIAKNPFNKQMQFDFAIQQHILSDNEWSTITNSLTIPSIDDWIKIKHEKKLKYWQSKVADHVLIPYVATADDPLRPIQRTHSPFDCDFTTLEDSKKLLSKRSRVAGKTQRTIKKQCSICYFGGNRRYKAVCNKYNPRRCKHGAWTEERIIDYTLERYDTALRAYSQLTLKTAWIIAQLTGIPFKVKSAVTKREREWQICSIRQPLPFTCRGTDAIRILVSRTARQMKYETLAFTSVKELKEFLPPSMLERWNSVSKIPIDRKAMALWCHASILTHAKKYSYYFSDKNKCGYLNHQPKIGSVRLAGIDSCRIGLSVLYSRRTKYLTFNRLDSLYSHFAELPLFEITDEEDDRFIPNLNYRPY